MNEQLIPRKVNLRDNDWLTLLASYDYLQEVSDYSAEGAQDIIKRDMPSLVPHIPAAEIRLQEIGLLSA